MRATLLMLMVAVGSCNWEIPDYSHGLICSSAGTCPPGQTCVAGENRCRHSCRTDHDCQFINGTGGASGYNEACDADGFCRQICGWVTSHDPTCNTDNLGGRLNCNEGEVCDPIAGPQGDTAHQGLCRMICSGSSAAVACGTGFTCQPMQQSPCGGCVPAGGM